jgi:hypothetical protein
VLFEPGRYRPDTRAVVGGQALEERRDVGDIGQAADRVPERGLETVLELGTQAQQVRCPLPPLVDTVDAAVVQLVEQVQRQVRVLTREGIVVDGRPSRQLPGSARQVVQEPRLQRASRTRLRAREVATVGAHWYRTDREVGGVGVGRRGVARDGGGGHGSSSRRSR